MKTSASSVSRFSFLLLAAVFLLSLSLGGNAWADTYTWSGSTTGGGGGSSNTWDTTSSNWTGFGTTWPTPSTTNDDAVFSGTAGTVSIASGGVIANELTFNTTGYLIQNNTLTLDGTAPAITTGSGVTAQISSVVAGSAGFTKKSAGSLILSNANTFGGTITLPGTTGTSTVLLTDGIIQFSNSKAAGSSTISIGGGYQTGRIDITGGIVLSNAITLQGRQGPTYAAINNLSGDNTISGSINVVANGARLNFFSSAGNLIISGSPMTGNNGRTLTLRGAGTGEFAKNITSTVVASVDKLDAGTWTISGSSNYTGATTVNGGKLIVTNANGLGTGNVSVAANASLDYVAKTDQPLAIGGNLTVTGSTTTAIGGSIGSSGTSATINVSGTATITNAAHSVNIYKALDTTAVTGTYTLVSGGSASSLNPATAPTLGKVFNNSDFTVGALSRTATTLDVAITAATPLTTAYWAGGLTGGTNVWALSNGSTSSNWSASAGGLVQALVPGVGTDVIMSGSSPAVAPTALVLGANTSIKSLTVSDTANGLGVNADSYTLTVGSGGITVAAGVPASAIGSRVALGAAQTWTNNSANALTVSGIVSGTGSLFKSGTGTVILSAANTYTGETRVQSGVLGLANVSALAGSVLNRDVADTGTLSFLVAGDNTYNLAGLSGNGSLDAGGKTLSIGATNLTTEFSGAMSNGNLTKVGTGTLTLSGSSTFTGDVTISAGTLRLANSGALGSSGTGTKFLYMQGTNRVLQLSNNITLSSSTRLTVSSNSGDGTGISNVDGTNEIQGQINISTGNPALNISSTAGTLTVSGNVTATATGRTLYLGGQSTSGNTISGVIGQGGGVPSLPLIKQGTGTWILSASNSYTGPTTVNGGKLIVTNANGLGTGSATVAAGASLDYAAKIDQPLNIGGDLTITGGTNAGGATTAIGGSIGSTTTSATINVSGAATISDAPHLVNIFKVAGTTTVTGTYTLISGGGGSALDPTTAPTVGNVVNNSDFTVGALSRTATTLDVEINAATPMTTAYWIGGFTGGTNVWTVSNGSTSSNWSASPGGPVQGLVPGAGTDVIVSGSTPVTAPTALVLGANTSIQGLTVSDTANGLGLNSDSNTLTVGSGGISVAAGVPASAISAKVALGAAQTWTNNSTNALTVSGVVSGTGSLFKSGTGTVILSAANTFTGQTRVQSGVLGLANVNAIAASVLNTSGTDTGSLSFLASDNTYNLGGLSGDGNLDAGGKTLSIGAANQPTEFSGVLSNGALTKVGTTTLTLSGSNTFTGNVTVNAGTLKVANSGGLGAGTKNFYMQGTGRVLQLSNNVTLGSNITLNVSTNSGDGAGIYSVDGNNEIQGAVRFDFGNPALNISSGTGSTLTVSGSVTLVTSSRTLYLGGASTNANTISGAIGQNGANALLVTKQGAGTWVLSGTNTYTGLTRVNEGTLKFDVSETLTGGLNVATSGTAVLTAHTGGAANVKVLDITALTISGTTAFVGDGGKEAGFAPYGGVLPSPEPVPEPGTIGLLAVGAIGGLLLRRRCCSRPL